MQLSLRQKAAFGIGAVGKDMVYALSANYVMYYYQDLLGIDAGFVGIVLMAARFFDAANDPLMGVLVAKTRTRFGRFCPWLVSGTVLNAFVLYALFNAPNLSGAGLMVFFPIIYVLWGVTYTMMDIPYWSMIPAITTTPKDTEHLSVIGRTCAGFGSAIVQVLTVVAVQALGAGNERRGFGIFALIVAVFFVVSELLCASNVRERPDSSMETQTVKGMFRSLFQNDQALIVVLSIVLIDTALYITSNLVIYFFKYDFGGTSWSGAYTLFTMVGGVSQILGMMVLYPLLRKKLDNTVIFRFCLLLAIGGYVILLLLCMAFGLAHSIPALLVPGILIFAANGMLSVLTTVFLSNSVDYGQIRTGHREESVIFSMQTFVVKASSGIAVAIAGLGLKLIGLHGNNATDEIQQAAQSASTLTGLRLLMTIIPMAVLFVALVVFQKKFKLTDDVVRENVEKIAAINAARENKAEQQG